MKDNSLRDLCERVNKERLIYFRKCQKKGIEEIDCSISKIGFNLKKGCEEGQSLAIALISSLRLEEGSEDGALEKMLLKLPIEFFANNFLYACFPFGKEVVQLNENLLTTPFKRAFVEFDSSDKKKESSPFF